ncbi:MAG: iron-sulfur cluster assembly scaffold protein [Emcibacter sp.]|nr:iron-sulfur cluster assembly scaffold protein [Emcibacter sp.]
MIDQLYQKAILKEAAAATGSGILSNPDVKLTVHNPLCGDRITIYLNLEGNKISEFSHETKACVLCQASASMLAECSIGETEQNIQSIYDNLKQGLLDKDLTDKIWPEEKWETLNIFQPVSDHKNRFTCVTLPFESILKALRGDSE